MGSEAGGTGCFSCFAVGGSGKRGGGVMTALFGGAEISTRTIFFFFFSFGFSTVAGTSFTVAATLRRSSATHLGWTM